MHSVYNELIGASNCQLFNEKLAAWENSKSLARLLKSQPLQHLNLEASLIIIVITL